MSVVENLGVKETVIGSLPIEWQISSLRDAGKIVSGGTPSTSMEEYWEGDIYWCTPTDITRLSGRRTIQSTERKITNEGLRNSGAVLIEKNSVLVCTRATVGVCAINAMPITTNQGFKSITPNEFFTSDYLYYAITNLQSELKKKAGGSTFLEINKTEFEKILICKPPLHEQRGISSILNTVDDKLDVIFGQIEATQTLKQGLMQTLFSRGVGTQSTNGFWLAHTEFKKNGTLELPVGWSLVRLGDIAPLIRRPVKINLNATYPELGLRSYGKGTFHKPALLGDNVGNKRLFEIKTGDLLFSNVFAWEGAVAVAKSEDSGRFGSHRYITCTVDESRADTSYVFRYLVTPAGIASLTLASPGGAGRNKTLGLEALANITMPLPPLAEQQKISQILDDVETKIKTLELKQSHYQTLKRGLMQKLLTGEWRVKLDDPTPTTEQ